MATIRVRSEKVKALVVALAIAGDGRKVEDQSDLVTRNSETRDICTALKRKDSDTNPSLVRTNGAIALSLSYAGPSP